MQNDEIFDFLLKETLILNPISEIIKNLEENKYWSKDIVFLEKQLQKYTTLAMEILNIKMEITQRNVSEHTMSNFKNNEYLNYFKKLLELFKDINLK